MGRATMKRETGSRNTGRILIAGLNSGCGKTTVALAVMKLLQEKGVEVAPFKVGPDFIDCKWHEAACGMQSLNLDGFMTGREYIRRRVSISEREGRVSVIEGMMGLFDGVRPGSDFGSSAWVARVLGAPVIGVIDTGSMLRSVIAIATGFSKTAMDAGVHLAGFVLSKTGGTEHYDACRRILEGKGFRVLGHLPYDPRITIRERRLGLTFSDPAKMRGLVKGIAEIAGCTLDTEEILQIARSALPLPATQSHRSSEVKRSVRIGVPLDAAFNFYYPDNLELLRSAGAELVSFSLLKGKMPEDIDGMYAGGGYPELHASSISKNSSALSRVREMSEQGMPIYSECGGFMALCNSIEIRGRKYRMAGVFNANVIMEDSPVIGYRKVNALKDSILGSEGTAARGHEFHHARADAQGELFRVDSPSSGKSWMDGIVQGKSVGSFIHLHFGSNYRIARNFVEACLRYGNRKH